MVEHGWRPAVLMALAHFAARIPRRRMTTAAPLLGRLWFRLDAGHRRIALDNIAAAFGAGMAPAAQRRLARASFIHLCRLVLEFPSLLKIDAATLPAYASFHGTHHLEQAFAKGRGVLLLTAHLGNWELMALGAAVVFRRPFDLVARPLDVRALDLVVTRIRTCTGNHLLDKNHSAGIIRELLRRNHAVGLLLDQNASWYDGAYVPFFGRTACTNKGLAMFALRYDAAVVPVFNHRGDDGRYRVRFHPPVTLERTGDFARDVLIATARFNAIIEENIRLAPEQWLWVHRRWRLKPVPDRVRPKVERMIWPGLTELPPFVEA